MSTTVKAGMKKFASLCLMLLFTAAAFVVLGVSIVLMTVESKFFSKDHLKSSLMLCQMTPEEVLLELKSQLLSEMSDEFRNPLTAILLSTEILENYSHRCSEEKKREYLCLIRESALKMNQAFNQTIARYDQNSQ